MASSSTTKQANARDAILFHCGYTMPVVSFVSRWLFLLGSLRIRQDTAGVASVPEPEGVGMCGPVRVAGGWCSDVAPTAWAWRMMGSTSAARAEQPGFCRTLIERLCNSLSTFGRGLGFQNPIEMAASAPLAGASGVVVVQARLIASIPGRYRPVAALSGNGTPSGPVQHRLVIPAAAGRRW